MTRSNRLLGYPDDARLLIVNADDFGMCQAVNEAVMRSFEGGLLRSATLMTPCPWAPHAMRFLAEHPEIPFGVHLTVVSDWRGYRWGPLARREKVPSLVDAAGYFHDFDAVHARLGDLALDELELEFRAQVETVLRADLHPTHLDWHSLRLNGLDPISGLMFRLAREYGLALRVRGREWIAQVQAHDLPCNDYDFLDSYLLDPLTKADELARLLHDLPPGLSEWAVHPALDTPELLAIEREENHIRQMDFDFLTSPEAQRIVEEEGITLLDYRALQDVWTSRAL